MKLKRMGLFTKILLIVLFVYAVTTIIHLRSEIEQAEAERAELQSTVENKKAENAEIKYYIENSNDAQVKEDIARDHGYIKQGEKVFHGE